MSKVIKKIGCVALMPHINPNTSKMVQDKFIGLSSSRGKGFIIPGGKFSADAGDFLFSDCAIREAFEETGIVINKHEYLFNAPDGYGYHVFCFWCPEYCGTLVSDAFKTSEGDACIVTRNQLMESEYRAWYEIMFHYYDNLMGQNE